MAEDFLPVGIRAVAEGVDQFVADMRRMSAAVHQVGQAAKDAGIDLRTITTSSNQAQASLRKLTGDVNRVANAHNTFNQRTAQAAQRMGATTLRARALSTAMRGLRAAVLLPHTAINAFTGVLTKFTGKMAALGERFFRAGNSIRFFGASLLFMVTLPILGFFGKLTTAAIDFEEAFIGIVRTVDDADFRVMEEGGTTMAELTERGRALERSVRDLALAIPLPVTELAKLGELAGTLGVRGVANLTTFIDTTAKLGATTNVTAEEAADSLGKIIGIAGGLTDTELSIIGMSDAEIKAADSSVKFQKSLEGLGGVIVALGNKTRAQEDEILSITEEIAASGELAGLTSAQMLGLGASFAAVGIEAARGRTAIQKTLFAIIEATQTGEKELEIFAAVAGETMDGFVKLFEEDAVEALRRFVEGLGQNGDKAIRILKELELGDVRVSQALLSLAGAEGEFSRALQIVNEELAAQGEGLSALEIEAARRFATTKSQLQILRNQFNELGITLGSFLLPELNKLIAAVRHIIELFGQLNPQIQRTVIIVGLLVAGIGPVVIAFGLLLSAIGGIIFTFSFLANLILSVVSGLGLLLIPIAAVTAAFLGLAVGLSAGALKISETAENFFPKLAQRMFEFGRNIILAFARGMAVALVAVIRVLNALGQVIARWLRPGSPPRLLPDLDKWGEQAMLEYMKGWASADFDIFNQIADKIEGFLRSIADTSEPEGRISLVERIIGTRKAIAQAVEEFRKAGQLTEKAINRVFRAMGGASENARNYIRALLDVAVAAERVKQIQEELNRVMEQYEKRLKPINRRLEQIADRQQEVADALRITELEAILDDPRATELARELAALEIEQIGLEADKGALEDQRDAETELINQRLKAAELELEAAQEILKQKEALIDVQIKNNQLVQELLAAIDALNEKLKKQKEEFGAGDITGFDPEGLLEDVGAGLDDVLDDIDTSIDSVITLIESAIQDLIDDLKLIFQPVVDEWNRLGETWAPIFIKAKRFIEGIFAGFNPFKDVTLPSDLNKILRSGQFGGRRFGGRPLISGSDLPPLFDPEEMLAPLEGLEERVRGFFENIFASVGGFLVDIGAVKPFGPLVAEMEKLGEGETLTEFGGRINALLLDIENFIRSPEVRSMIRVGGRIAAAFEGVDFEGIAQSIAGIADAIGPAFNTLSKFARAGGRISLGFFEDIDFSRISDAFTGAIESISGALERLGISLGPETTGAMKDFFSALGGIVQFLPQILLIASQIAGAGLFQGIVEGISVLIDGLGIAITGIINFISGVLSVVTGIADIIVGAFAIIIGHITGDLNLIQEGADTVVQGFNDLLSGIITIGASILQFITGLVTAILGTIIKFALGFAKGVLDAVGRVTGFLPDSIRKMVNEIVDTIGQWVDDSITAIDGMIDLIIGAFQHLFDELIGRSLIPDMLESITTAFSTFITDTLDKIETWISDIINDATAFKDDLLGIFQELWDNALEALGNFIDAFLDFFINPNTGLIARMLQFGADVIQGFIDGIESGLDALNQLIEDIVNSIPEPIRDILGLSSPSKLFKSFGQDMMRGWIIGLESMQPEFTSTISGLAELAVASAQAPLAQPAFSPAPVVLPAQAGQASRTEINASVDMGGQTINNGLDVLTLQILIEQALRNVLQ